MPVIRALRDPDIAKFIDDAEYARLTSRCAIQEDDILYTTVGSYGNAARVPPGQKFAFQRHIAHIKPDHDLVDSRFLEVMLESQGVRRQADKLARGVAQKTLNLRELKSFLVFAPPLKHQQKFGDFVDAVDAQAALADQHLAQLDQLFSSLQSSAFSGRL